MFDFWNPEIVMFGQLVLAAFLGMLVGTERVAAGKNAGMRTFAFVSLGACLFVIMSETVDARYLGLVNFDPMRVAAAVIMGIGFLTGGLIFLQGKSLQGLTTAAGLWVSTGIGMAVGFGLYSIAVFASFLTLMIFTFMWVLENWLKRTFQRMRVVELEGGARDSDQDSVPDSEERLSPLQ